MSIELAEKLKQKLTDKWVVVDPAAPELKRFAQWTGKVRTVNMNGRALVEFDGPVDIGWYDIDPAFLTVVDGPKPKAAPAPKKEAAPAAKAAAPAAAKPAGGSPLDAIRAAGAAKPAAAAAPAAGEKKLSPIEIMRAQAAAKAAAAGGAPAAPPAPVAAAPVEASAATPAPVETPAKPAIPTTGPGGKKLSPLEMARLQGAAKKPS